MRGQLVVKDGRVSVSALAIGLINRIGKPKAVLLANEILADVKAPAPEKSRASAGAKRTLADIQPVKGAAPQKGQLPAGLVKWLKANRKAKAAPSGATGAGRRRAASG